MESNQDLIVVPCWWDGSIGRLIASTINSTTDFKFYNSLAASIKLKRPDLLTEFDVGHFEPIPLTAPNNHFNCTALFTYCIDIDIGFRDFHTTCRHSHVTIICHQLFV